MNIKEYLLENPHAKGVILEFDPVVHEDSEVLGIMDDSTDDKCYDIHNQESFMEIIIDDYDALADYGLYINKVQKYMSLFEFYLKEYKEDKYSFIVDTGEETFVVQKADW